MHAKRPAAPIQGYVGGGCSRLNLRNRSHLLYQFLLDGLVAIMREVEPIEIHGDDDDAVPAESRIQSHEVLKAPDKERRSDQKDKRNRNLCHHEHSLE